MNRSLRLLLTSLLAIGALTLAGCGDGDERGSTRVSGSLVTTSAANPAEVPAAGEVNIFRGEELVQTVTVDASDQGKFDVQLTPATYVFKGTLPNADCADANALVTPNGSGNPIVVRCTLP